MKIVACIKQVPDTATRVRVKPGGDGIETEGIQYVVNPYDEFAVEEALRIKERLGEGEVTVVTLGPARSKEALRSCLAMGADRAMHLIDEAFEGSDTYGTALILSKAIARQPFDLVLCGKQAVDGDASQVGAQLAEMLDIPQVSVVTKLELAPDRRHALAHRQIEGATEVLEVTLPALVTCQKGLNEPRYPSLKGIMGAKKKEILELHAADLSLEPASVGVAGSKIKVIGVSLPPQRSSGKVVGGPLPDSARELVRLLREEAKAI